MKFTVAPHSEIVCKSKGDRRTLESLRSPFYPSKELLSCHKQQQQSN
ncbi:hypothetical protein H6G80_32480 [Nostoc sp. FACHB-87]|nr:MULTISPECIES: hypothetical protein [Nostocaceae]MBD2458764.1 hypothetical protein [Nostoc sp. FACHB-87]MBD2479816.1 hypothetical protein [Anabaena sp. FACHB-83]